MPPETEPEVERCQVTYRVLFDSAATVRRLPGPASFAAGRVLTRLRRNTPWLQEMPFDPVRYALRSRADAW